MKCSLRVVDPDVFFHIQYNTRCSGREICCKYPHSGSCLMSAGISLVCENCARPERREAPYTNVTEPLKRMKDLLGMNPMPTQENSAVPHSIFAGGH